MVANVTRSRTSHIQITHDIFSFIERPQPNLSCVKIWQSMLQQLIFMRYIKNNQAGEVKHFGNILSHVYILCSEESLTKAITHFRATSIMLPI